MTFSTVKELQAALGQVSKRTGEAVTFLIADELWPRAVS